LAIEGPAHIFRNEGEEGRWVHLERTAIEETALNVRQDEPRPGPGHPHIKEASFLFQVPVLEEETGEEPVLAPGDKDHLPFKPFGRMKGHERDPVALQQRMIYAPLQGKGIQKGLQIPFALDGQVPETGQGPVGLVGIRLKPEERQGLVQYV